MSPRHDLVNETRTPAPHWALDCAYFRGVGTCTGSVDCSTAGEPRCITETPYPHGWQRRDTRGRFLPQGGTA